MSLDPDRELLEPDPADGDPLLAKVERAAHMAELLGEVGVATRLSYVAGLLRLGMCDGDCAAIRARLEDDIERLAGRAGEGEG